MPEYIRRLGVPLALALAVAVGACDRDNAGQDTGLATDTSLANDLALAGGDTAAPQLSDTAATNRPAPRPTTPRRTTPRQPSTPSTTPSGNRVETGRRGSEGTVVSIPAGTTLSLASNEKVCSNTNKVGDTFTARTSEAVTTQGVTIPSGARVTVRITNLRKSENVNEPIVMTFAVQSISWGGKTYPLNAEVTYAQVDKVRTASKSSDIKKVAGGAVVGAVIGQVLGKDTKSTVIGAATGAAAGTAVAMATGDYDGCIPDGGKLTIRLTEAVQVQAE